MQYPLSEAGILEMSITAMPLLHNSSVTDELIVTDNSGYYSKYYHWSLFVPIQFTIQSVQHKQYPGHFRTILTIHHCHHNETNNEVIGEFADILDSSVTLR